jgi:hypothetical protein
MTTVPCRGARCAERCATVAAVRAAAMKRGPGVDTHAGSRDEARIMRLPALALVCTACGLSAADTRSDDALLQTSGAQTAAAPQATLSFNADWSTTQRGALVRGGHVDVSHSPLRVAQCPNSTILSFARFQPSGAIASSDEAFGFDIPSGTTSVELWFHAVAPGCDAWDSNFGKNWSFPVLAAAPPDVGWAGDWGSSTDRSCTHQAGVKESISIDEYMRERACIFIDLDVWVLGVTDVSAAHPEYLAASVSWSKDGSAPTIEPLEYQRPQWHNARFRWNVPDALRNHDDWSTASYSFSVSSDGMHTHRYAQGSGAERTLVRAFTFTH